MAKKCAEFRITTPSLGLLHCPMWLPTWRFWLVYLGPEYRGCVSTWWEDLDTCDPEDATVFLVSYVWTFGHVTSISAAHSIFSPVPGVISCILWGQLANFILLNASILWTSKYWVQITEELLWSKPLMPFPLQDILPLPSCPLLILHPFVNFLLSPHTQLFLNLLEVSPLPKM